MVNMIPTIICLVVGLILLVVEMFTPGLGAAGGLGVLVLLVAVLLQIGNPVSALFLIALILFLIAVGIVLFLLLANRGKFDRSKIVLGDSIQSGSTPEAAEAAYIDRVGTAQTVLRPAGKALFDGALLDVVTSGEFIDKGVSVRVIAVEGRRILVKAEA
ncbi:MAG: NfeD family protein [Eubacteriales bacterium]|nr:NfeD family protein [Eubacteriales bacterium]